MLGWEHVPERLGPQAPGWAVQENENDTRLCPEGLGRSICCSSVRSPTPSHTQTFLIKWEVYFSKRTVSSLFFASVCILHIYVYICIYIMYWVYNIWSGRNGKETLHRSCTNSHPPFLCLFWIILSIRSEEVLLILVLLIHINTHKRMEINL